MARGGFFHPGRIPDEPEDDLPLGDGLGLQPAAGPASLSLAEIVDVVLNGDDVLELEVEAAELFEKARKLQRCELESDHDAAAALVLEIDKVVERGEKLLGEPLRDPLHQAHTRVCGKLRDIVRPLDDGKAGGEKLRLRRAMQAYLDECERKRLEAERAVQAAQIKAAAEERERQIAAAKAANRPDAVRAIEAAPLQVARATVSSEGFTPVGRAGSATSKKGRENWKAEICDVETLAATGGDVLKAHQRGKLLFVAGAGRAENARQFSEALGHAITLGLVETASDAVRFLDEIADTPAPVAITLVQPDQTALNNMARAQKSALALPGVRAFDDSLVGVKVQK